MQNPTSRCIVDSAGRHCNLMAQIGVPFRAFAYPANHSGAPARFAREVLVRNTSTASQTGPRSQIPRLRLLERQSDESLLSIPSPSFNLTADRRTMARQKRARRRRKVKGECYAPFSHARRITPAISLRERGNSICLQPE